MKHFKAISPSVAGYDILAKMISIFILHGDEIERCLSKNFQSIVQRLGQAVAGDEKLYYFSGQDADVRLCISKPDRIGLWFYELVMQLRNGRHYMLCVRLHTNKTGDPVKVAGVLRDWLRAMDTIGAKRVTNAIGTFMTSRFLIAGAVGTLGAVLVAATTS